MQTWNEKYLDYEIETLPCVVSKFNASLTWNEKYLDYEIETKLGRLFQDGYDAWNEKYLDYEIET